MKRPIITVSTLFLLLSTLTFTGFVVVNGETEVGFTIKMSVTYYNNGTENWDFTEEDRAISLFMNNTWQTVQLINHSRPIENVTFDEDGNPMAFLEFPGAKLEPGENISYNVTYYALSKPRSIPDIKEEESGNLNAIPTELNESYCGAGDAWLVNDLTLQDLAYNITKSETKVLTIVKNFITWIRDNITYKTQDTPRYPNETYAEGEGDCDDQAILFITLCRILGIPAHLQVGCIYISTILDDSTYWNDHVRSVLKRIGWHGWAMVYVPPWGWLPVDLTYVMGGFGDPLNAIKTAAVTSQNTLQYMNISQTDYINSSLTYRNFLTNNNFSVYMQDEMTKTSPTNPVYDLFKQLFTWILVTTVVVAIVIIAWIFIVIRRKKKLKETEFKFNSSFGS